MQLKKQTRRRVCRDCGARKGKVSDLNCNNFENHSLIVSRRNERNERNEKNEKNEEEVRVPILQTYLTRVEFRGVDRRRRQVNVQA